MKTQREIAEEYFPLAADKHYFMLEEFGAFGPHLKWEYVDGALFYSNDSRREPLMKSFLDDDLERFDCLFGLYQCWDFLSVWHWLDNYSMSVADGMQWRLSGSIFGHEFKSGGDNAFPAYSSADKLAATSQRYLLMFYGMLNAYCVSPDHQSWQTLTASRSY